MYKRIEPRIAIEWIKSKKMEFVNVRLVDVLIQNSISCCANYKMLDRSARNVT